MAESEPESNAGVSVNWTQTRSKPFYFVFGCIEPLMALVTGWIAIISPDFALSMMTPPSVHAGATSDVLHYFIRLFGCMLVVMALSQSWVFRKEYEQQSSQCKALSIAVLGFLFALLIGDCIHLSVQSIFYVKVGFSGIGSYASVIAAVLFAIYRILVLVSYRFNNGALLK